MGVPAPQRAGGDIGNGVEFQRMAEVSVRPQNDEKQTYAALDLGSNSFHLIVALDWGDRLQVVDKHREMVRLAEGLGPANILAPKTTARALECLDRLGQRLRLLPASNVRVVGTNTLRKARNSQQFIARAQEVLGHEVEVISGREEARLIYLGVSHSLEDNHDTRLVIDIGGGSTELILGQHFQPQLAESLYIGCADLSDRFFKGGRIDAQGRAAAVGAARQEFEIVERIFRANGWDNAVGASGTIIAVHDIIEAELGSKDITPEGLDHVTKRVIESGHVDNFDFYGVDGPRAPVFPGGVAILRALFGALDIRSLAVSNGALREGLLHDLLGRIHDQDIREKTVLDLARRFSVDQDHARRVAATAQGLFERVAPYWDDLDPNVVPLLRWSAMLHEIGLDIAHSQYHKHGGYLLDNMDMPGFSRSEQHRLSLLVRAHRRKFPVDDFVDALDLVKLCVLLRIAVVLHRGRSDMALPPFDVRADDDFIRLTFPKNWVARHPLTQLDLDQEAEYLQWSPIRLSIRK